MPNPENVPAPDLFNRFLLGTLSLEERREVERYLENQPTVAETLLGLTPAADTFLVALQGAPAAPPSAPEVRDIVESAKRLVAATGMTHLGDTAAAAAESRAEAVSGISGAPADLLSFLAPAEQPDELGRLGGYRVLRVLGMGGMGVVFEAEDPRLVRRVALKVVRPTIAKDQGVRDRFLREARAAAAIEHDHVVTIHQVGEDRGVPFLAMPLLQGESLDDRLRREKRLPAAEVIRTGREIAEGLAAAHDHGLIHRDIKPGNIWLDRRTGRVKILDFGLARGTEQIDEPQLTLAGSIIGTPAYMAPEQAQGQSLDGRCDLFSLGCILFRAVTGELPFPGNTPMQILSSLATHTPSRVDSLVADAPAALADLIARLLAKSPTDRPASAHEVVRALQAIIAPTSPIPIAIPVTQPIGVAVNPVINRPAVQKDGGPAPQPARRGGRPVVAALALLAVLGGLTWQFGVVVIRIVTNSGELIVEVDQPGADVEVRTMAGAVEIRETAKSEPIKISVHPGKHKLEVTKVGFTLFAKEFELALGGQKKITAKLVPLSSQPAKTTAEPQSPTLAMHDPAFAEWVRSVQSRLAEEQVKAVAAKLKELNPGFDGNVIRTIENGVVSELQFVTNNVTDISPVRALVKLQRLDCAGSFIDDRVVIGRLEDLSPVKGMKLSVLNISRTQVADLSPIAGMPLIGLFCGQSQVSDLSPLAGMPLVHLSCGSTKVANLAPLKGMPLSEFNCSETQVSDLSPLEGMSLTSFRFFVTPVSDLSPLHGMPLAFLQFGACSQVSDLSPLKGMPLTSLDCQQTKVADLTPLRGMPLESLVCTATKVSNLSPLKDIPLKFVICDFRPFRDIELLQSVKTLEQINGKPVSEFWKEVERQQAAFDAWTKRVTAMPPDEQVKAVVAKLWELNPEFDGKVTPTIENSIVTSLEFLTEDVTDISPVRALPGLRKLNFGKGRLADLSPLIGMQLNEISCGETLVADLSPLKGMPLHRLECWRTPVADLTPLAGMSVAILLSQFTQVSNLWPLKGLPLTSLDVAGTRVDDLSPLKGMPLQALDCSNTRVTDLSPLAGMPLFYVHFSNTPIDDLSALKGMPLTQLACNGTKVSDLSPLAGTKLNVLFCQQTPVVSLSPLAVLPLTRLECDSGLLRNSNDDTLRSIKTLEKVNGKPAAEFWQEVDIRQGAFESWIKRVARLPVEQQSEAVAAKLKEMNPSFDGKVESGIENGVVHGLVVPTDEVSDISPVRALGKLKGLICTPSGEKKGKLADLSPLKGMQFTHLTIAMNPVADLTPLQGMPLMVLNVRGTPVADLSPLQGLKLTALDCRNTQVTDLSPLKGMALVGLAIDCIDVDDLSPLAGMPLTSLFFPGTKVSDLAPLAGMPLVNLHCEGTKVSDLSPLRGMPLADLRALHAPVASLAPLKGMKLTLLQCSRPRDGDLSPLKDMPLKNLFCEFDLQRDAEILRSIKTLEQINNKPAAEFWKDVK